MDINSVNPYIRIAKHSTLLIPFHIAKRSIYDYELIYVQNGSFCLLYDGTEHVCKSGDIILIHPGIEHEFISRNADISQPHIHFDLEYSYLRHSVPISFKSKNDMNAAERMMISEDKLRSDSPSPILRISDTERFLRIFFEIIDESSGNEKMTELEKRSKMMMLIDIMIKDNYPELLSYPTAHASEIEYVKSYIDTNFSSDVSLKSLCAHFHYSRSYLENHFTDRYGISIMQYCRELKMKKAKEMLETMSVTSVCEALSFSSVFSFSRSFKNRFGVSPRQYKMENK